MSCATSKPLVSLPKIDFPEFPIDPDKVTVTVEENKERVYSNVNITWSDNSMKKVTLPYWFWSDLMNYAIDSDTARQKYEVLRNNYGIQQVSDLQ